MGTYQIIEKLNTSTYRKFSEIGQRSATGDWRSVATTRDGAGVFAASYGGRLWYSADGGTNWVEQRPISNANYNWNCVAVNGDGTVRAAGVYGGGLYVSRNSGVTWTAVTHGSLATPNWISVSISGDGTKIVGIIWGEGRPIYISGTGYTGTFMGELYFPTKSAITYDGATCFVISNEIVKTTNFSTWTVLQRPIDIGLPYTGVSVSDDGLKVVTCHSGGIGNDGAAIYRSTNGGSSWTDITPDLNKNWSDCAIDADGGVVWASAYGGRVFRSNNGGSSWTEMRPAGDVNRNWRDIAINVSGTIAYLGIQNASGIVYKTVNGGSLWSELTPVGVDRQWQCIATSSDGSKVIAGAYGGRLYYSSDYGATFTEVQPAGDANQYWSVCDVADNGDAVACYGIGRVYKYTFATGLWTDVRPTGVNEDRLWRSVSISDDSQTIYALYNSGNTIVIRKSTNSGASWASVLTVNDGNLLSEPVMVVSKDGSKIVMISNRSVIRYSSNGGSSFSIVTHPTATNPTIAAISRDGSVFSVYFSSVTGDQGVGKIWQTTNGATWGDINPTGSTAKTWKSISYDNTGNRIFAVSNNNVDSGGRAYFSSTSGVSWDELNIVGFVNTLWTSSAMSSDASNIYAGVVGGRLYKGEMIEFVNSSKIVSGFFIIDKLKPILINKQQHSYKNTSTINIKLSTFNYGYVSYLEGLESVLYFDYSGDYTQVSSAFTNRYGSYDFSIQSNIVPSNVKNFNAISKVIYRNSEYFSNIIRINIK